MDKLATIQKWLTAYQRSDYVTMSDCYAETAVFKDIAFDLEGRDEIGLMWRMICDNGIEVIEDIPPRLDGDAVIMKITDKYQFQNKFLCWHTEKPVVNEIASRFEFHEDGRIQSHQDSCDEKAWAAQALGGAFGWLAGQSYYLRNLAAKRKLCDFKRKLNSKTR